MADRLALNTAGQSAPLQSSGFLQAPLGLTAVAVASGIFLAHHLQRPANLWAWCAGLLIACTLAALYRQNSNLARVAVILALVCAGAFTASATPPPHSTRLPDEFLSGARVLITGHVINDGSLLAGGSRERFDLQTDSVQLGDTQFTQPTGIRVSMFVRGAGFSQTASVPEEEADLALSAPFPLLNYGDRVRLTAKLRPPRNFRNPGAFDYEGYL
ncbi:MAG TPA: ComEC/Rec2 family competence protein, partial [Candidatus Angelobacter sp.]|nr:ComEC/Rec2 family competence protein [Candidatus Angelobacter sp.]